MDVEWFPSWSLAEAPGKFVTIDDRAAKLFMGPDGCGGLDADRGISVAIAREIKSNWYELDGCFREPGAEAAIAEVRALLDSVRVD